MRDPAEIVAAALEGHDVAARRALARFCSVLGSVSGDAALIHGARTLVIAGGMVPRFMPFLRSSNFRERFLAKGRFAAYLEGITIHVITHPQPGLLGRGDGLAGIRGSRRMNWTNESRRAAVDAILDAAPVMPVLSIERLEDAVPLARALADNGLPVLEITLRTPVAREAIARIAREVPNAIVGAGTVLRADDLRSMVGCRCAFRDRAGLHRCAVRGCSRRADSLHSRRSPRRAN